jgi:LmbE family N-acetylglucosaminyl deacetylase
MGLTGFSGKILVICPHFDDACFSVGGLLSRKTSAKVAVLTVFSKSQSSPNSLLLRSFSKASKFSKLNFLRGLATEFVSRLRQKEDWRFCDSVSAAQHLLPFEDSELRGYSKPFLANMDWVDKDPVYNSVFTAIEKCVSPGSYDSILCPLAIGNHVDHLIVLKAFLQILHKNRDIAAEVFFYEDLPYASTYRLDSISSLALNRTGSGTPLLVDVTMEMPLKQDLADVYRSQSNGDEKERIAYHARRLFVLADKRVGAKGYCERFWRMDLS